MDETPNQAVKIVPIKEKPTVSDRLVQVVTGDDGGGNGLAITCVTIAIVALSILGTLWVNDKLGNNFHQKQIQEINLNHQNELRKEREARESVERLNAKAKKDVETAYVVSTTLQKSLEELRSKNEEANNCLGLVIPNQLRK